jgi:hypothetical protein
VGADAKARLVDAFDVTLGQLQSCLGALIGADATSVLFRSACREAWQHYPWLQSIDVDAAASHVDRLRSHLDGITYVELRESLAACIETILALVADVTGDVLVRKMYPYAQQFRQHVEE